MNVEVDMKKMRKMEGISRIEINQEVKPAYICENSQLVAVDEGPLIFSKKESVIYYTLSAHSVRLCYHNWMQRG